MRVLRILEMEGTPSFIRGTLEYRKVKGTLVTQNGRIREAILGDPWDALAQAEVESWKEKEADNASDFRD